MMQWFAANPLAAGAVMFVLMWVDWFLTILQEREMRAHYGEHYQSYPVDTIEGHPMLQQAVKEKRLIEPRHFLSAIVLSVVVVVWLIYVPPEWREPTLGYVWGLFLIVITTHLGNLIGYRASRRGLHGKLYLHLRTGYLVQMGRYAALAIFLLVLAVCTASPFMIGVAVAGLTSALRQLLWLRRVPAIPEVDQPLDAAKGGGEAA
jgi:hypothetical protein